MAKQKKQNNNIIVLNKKARHDYFIAETLEAGLSLEGWEVKSLRSKKVQLKEGYILLKNGELFLFGAHITPLKTASSHIDTDPIRNRKLLLHKKEIRLIIEKITQKGITAVPLSLYWQAGVVKLSLGLAKGKKQHDKRAVQKDRDWSRDKNRIFRNSLK